MTADTKSKLAVGVSVLVPSFDEKALLMGTRLNNSAAGLLSTPGGRIEQSEDMYSCAARELWEETSLIAPKGYLQVLGFAEHFRYDNHYIMFYIVAWRYEGTIRNLEPEKCAGWDWQPVDNLITHPEITTEPLNILVKYRTLLLDRRCA